MEGNEPIIPILGTRIEYDSDIIYGIFNSQWNYEHLDVEKTLPRWADGRSKERFLAFLSTEARDLRVYLEDSAMVDALLDKDIPITTDPQSKKETEKQRQEIQNTINFFAYIAETLKK